jgi:hypothetical protein
MDYEQENKEEIKILSAYELELNDIKDIDKRFTYHPPKDGYNQTERYKILRDIAKSFAVDILRACPSSRERSLALTNLEQAVFWANAAIARNE